MIKQLKIDVSNSSPMITWGTSPEMAVGVNGKLPDLDDEKFSSKEKIC